MRLKLLVCAAGLLALAACGPPAQTPAANGQVAGKPGWIEKNSIVGDWIPIGKLPEGGVISYDAKSITRDAAAGTADVMVQVHHEYGQFYHTEDKTTSREIQFNTERFIYRFKCAAGTFAMPERRIMGEGDVVIETLKSPPMTDADWRPVKHGGPASLVEGPACRST